MNYNNYCQNRILKAMATQQTATYGLFLSPKKCKNSIQYDPKKLQLSPIACLDHFHYVYGSRRGGGRTRII
jgi:hypothetical protein